MTPRFPRPRRVVVKIGSSTLRAPDGGLDLGLVDALGEQVSELVTTGVEVVLVSSGAVAAGLGPLGLAERPVDLPDLQAAASVGQGLLMHAYQESFRARGLACGQVLLTPDDVVDRGRYLNARHTFDRLMARSAVPVVNENDTVATDELRFGDNDRLAALVASMLGAGLLILLSDVEGLLDGDPAVGAALPVLGRVDDLTSLDERHYGHPGSAFGSGGMASKLEAVRIATFSAAHAVIANARGPQVVTEVTRGALVGTWFPPARRRPESRKLWIAFARVPRGRLHVDEGAVRALIDRGSSLLSAGVVKVEGEFAAGDAVDVAAPDGRVVARGLATYGHDHVRAALGRSTDQLQPDRRRAVIHRDQLVVLA